MFIIQWQCPGILLHNVSGTYMALSKYSEAVSSSSSRYIVHLSNLPRQQFLSFSQAEHKIKKIHRTSPKNIR